MRGNGKNRPKKDDLVKATTDCEAKYIFHDPRASRQSAGSDISFKYTGKSDSSTKIITFVHADGCISYQSLLDRSRGPYRPVPCDPKNDVAALMSSLRTTGFPKGVMLSHYALVSVSIQMNAIGSVKKHSALVVMEAMSHGYGLYIITANGHTLGSNVVVMSKFTPDAYLELIQKYKPNQLHVVPFILVMFAKYPKVKQYDLSSVKKITCGASTLSQEIEEMCRKRFNLRNIDQKPGDLGMEDKDGFLFIVGRLKELIKYKGMQVAPAILEDTLLTHRAVAECAVIGIPDEMAGELPKASVVKKAGEHVTSKELIDYVADRVAPNMYLRGGIRFINKIPRTLSGKTLRRVLQDKSTQLLKPKIL